MSARVINFNVEVTGDALKADKDVIDIPTAVTVLTKKSAVRDIGVRVKKKIFTY